MAGTWRISRTCYLRRVSPWASLLRFGGRGRIRRGLSSTRGIRCGRSASSTLHVAHITGMVTPAPTMPLRSPIRFLLTEWYAHCADVKSSCLPAPLRHIADARLDLGCPISELPRLRPCAAESAPRAQVHHTRGAGAAGAAPSAVSFRGGPAALYCGHRRNLQATRAQPAAAWWMVISLPLAIRLATRPTARRHTSPQCAEPQHGWDGRYFRA